MEETLVDINSLRLCICRWGHPQGSTVLILHGWLDHAGAWSKVAEHLAARGHHVIIPDQRGHGKSEHAPASSHYHFADYVADVMALIDHQGIKRFSLIGHSMGGTVSTIHSAFASSKPERLILIEGLGPVHEPDAVAAKRYKQHLMQRLEEKAHRPMDSLDIAAQKLRRINNLAVEWSLEQAKRLTIERNGQFYWRWDPRHREKSAIGFHLPRHLSMLSHIDIPTDLVFGERSWYKGIPDLQQRIESFSSTPKEHRIDSGHSPHLECPKDLSTLLGRLLE
jgi:pimeloyl-ACP methyl ester carboxylesterase